MASDLSTTPPTVQDLVDLFEQAYPPELAEEWDAVGLICGDPTAPVRTVVFALDCTDAVAQRAIDEGADMLVVHHPLLLRGVTSVAAHTPKGRIIHSLIRNEVALFAAHTNADSARPGVNDALAQLVGITPGRPLAPKAPATIHTWGVNTPAAAVAAVKSAVFAAGGGAVGQYREVSYEYPVHGQFRPEAEANPTEGRPGELTTVTEVRVEFIAPASRRSAIEAAIRQAHPYEEPAFEAIAMVPAADLDHAPGLGRIGDLPEPMTLAEFSQQVASALPETTWGIRVAGDPQRIIRTVAVASGAGDSFLATAAQLGADVFISSDLRHHPVDEHLRTGGPAIIDTAHWASEFPWTWQARDLVRSRYDIAAEVLDIRTDPWTISAHPQHS